ncbi:MAG: tRNA uridine-5-carboxymethylaminomethyl(34) synthesis GTPase MnmE [Lysobacterales bacterium]|jgi:tRNA modification GTPase|nr:MAG: tRNA uridine-5-carboxymethylaminomethyl(34) synthesis GTPase MnmE [Xanthomonadales bacterium]
MPASSSDTIAAIATAPGRGGVGVVRISGPACRQIASALLERPPPPRMAALREFRDADGLPIDHGLALHFPGPASFTGEDVLELHGHGGPVVLDLLLRRVLALGARLAEPGEFTQRAFLNGKLDLAQAEAVADLIDSGSDEAARAAVRSMQGEFSLQVHDLVEALLQLRMWIEAAIDFPDEDVDFIADRALAERMDDIRGRFADLAEAARQGALLRDGLTLVIAGRPNAGKSSLLNRLAGYDAAIVAALPGTTRDVLRERIEIDGLPLHVLDTAGLRDSPDEIEAEGIRRAHREIERADRVLFVVDAADPDAVDAVERDIAALPTRAPRTVVYNKIDRTGAVPTLDAPRSAEGRGTLQEPRTTTLHLSASTGAGLDLLRRHLKDCVGFHPAGTGALSARTRHLDALRRARSHVEAAHRLLVERHAGELVAQELTDAQRALGEITGEVTSEDLLGRIFAAFCIGK